MDLKNQALLILRPGIISKKQIENFLNKEGLPFELRYHKDLFQPGGSTSHYKPSVPLYIVESEKTKKEIRSYFAKKHPLKRIKELKLIAKGEKSAQQIYSQLIKLSENKNNLIYVQKKAPQQNGLWTTIWDRLEKASFKRIKL